MFSACRNCPRSAIQAQEEVLDPCCEPYAQPSPSLAFFTGSKKAWDWMSNGSLQSHSLAAFSCRGGQSIITHFCIDKLSELQITLVGELTSAITLILMRRAGNSHSAETSETDFGHGRVYWMRFSTKKLFSRRDYSINTCNVKWFIYLLFSETIS